MSFGRTPDQFTNHACGPLVIETNEAYAELVKQYGSDIASGPMSRIKAASEMGIFAVNDGSLAGTELASSDVLVQRYET